MRKNGALILAMLCLIAFTRDIFAETITLSAAISLKESLTQIAKTYESETGDQVEFNFGASGPLAVQIEQGDSS